MYFPTGLLFFDIPLFYCYNSSQIALPIKSPVASAAFWMTLFEEHYQEVPDHIYHSKFTCFYQYFYPYI